MKIAYTISPGRGKTDLLLSSLAKALEADGITPCGTVQINTERPNFGPCDMDVMILPNGPTMRISQALGSEAKGCRLEPDALEAAVCIVEKRLAEGANCLIVNKFGKHEAQGRGFRTVIAEAISKDMPVLVGLNELNRPAFQDFCAGLAVQLAPQEDVLLDWFKSQLVTKGIAA